MTLLERFPLFFSLFSPVMDNNSFSKADYLGKRWLFFESSALSRCPCTGELRGAGLR